MNYYIEKHINGYCLFRASHAQVSTGAPHMKGSKYFQKKKEAEEFRKLIDIDTFEQKENWTPEHHALYETIPEIVRSIAGDMFEVKWYSHYSYSEMMEEAQNNWFNKTNFEIFKRCYDSLVNEQKNLIYYAYEA